MRLSLRCGLAAWVAAAMPSGCSATALDEAAVQSPKAVPGVNAAVAFEQKGTLKLAPGALSHLTVRTTPPNAYAIAFRLVGDSRDASLDRSSAVTGSDGRATVALRAPNQATTFAVRATIKDGPSADQVVSVSELGYATLDISPIYNGGRIVTEWFAAAASGTTCAALSKTLPADPDGALKSQAATWQPLLIADAPVGPALAVAVRAGHYAWGCADAGGLTAGAASKIEVHVTNKPLDPSQSKLDLSLVFAPEPEPYKLVVAQHLALMTAAFGAKDGQPAALLGAMAKVAPDANGFNAASTNNGWLAKLEQHWISAKIDLALALQQLAGASSAAPPLIEGRVTSIGEPSHALFTLKSIGPLSAAEAAAPSEYLLSLSVDPDDTVHLGGTLYLMPSRYLGAAISAAALLSDPQKKSFAEVLGAIVGCDKLTLPGLPGCNSECVGKLCHQAVGLLWQQARDASANNGLAAQIPMKASGAASFNDTAALTGFTGTWLGQLSSGKLSVKVSGTAKAVESGAPPPPM